MKEAQKVVFAVHQAYVPSKVKPIQKKCKWTKEEDQQLLKLIYQYGMKKWNIIPKYFVNRNGKQCRERFQNNLDPSVKRCSLSKAEGWALFLLNRKYGHQWAKIAKILGNTRTSNHIKNYCHYHMHKSLSEMQIKLRKKIDKVVAKVSKVPLNEHEYKRIENKVISNLELWYIEEVKRQNLNYFRKKAYNLIKLDN